MDITHETQKFKKGSFVNFQFMFPEGTKRLLFCLRKNALSENLIEQLIENPSGNKGVAEVVVSNAGTSMLEIGNYKWYITGLRNDGTRDTWIPFSEGEIEFYEDFPEDGQQEFPFGISVAEGLKNEEKSAIIY
jgi:hypothetical protein